MSAAAGGQAEDQSGRWPFGFMAPQRRRFASLLKLNRASTAPTLIETDMLDTRSSAPVVYSTDRADSRIGARPKPSFGLGSLRSRKELIGLGTAVFLAIGLFYTTFTPSTYTASSQLLIYIKQILTGADLAILPGRADLPLVQNQIELLRSGNVLSQVVETLQLEKDPEFAGPGALVAEFQKRDPGNPSPQADQDSAAYSAALDAIRRKLKVKQVGTSHLITVSLKASEPDKAARIVNSVIRVYFQELVRVSDAVSAKAPALRELYQSLGPSANLISAAEPPVRADGPPAALIVIAAALFGFGIAATAAILLDVMNDTIRSTQQMEYVLGLPCLGVVRRQDNVIVSPESAAKPPLSERRTLQHITAAILDPSLRGLRAVGVTSTLPGEGTTTVAVALAHTVSALGKNVLLIDGASENPSVSRWLTGVPGTPRRATGEPVASVLDMAVKVQAGLHVLPLADLRDGKAILSRPASLDGTLRDAAGFYDLVIVDMPSLAEGPDVRAAARSLDGFLLVVKWGATESELVRQGFETAGDARRKFIGAVLNMADEARMKRYGYELPAELRTAMAS